MAGISKVILVGNLGRDPEARYTPSGRLNVQFTMAVNRSFRDQSGMQQDRTTWYRVTAWGNLAEAMVKLSEQGALAKGRQVYVEGRLEPREYQDKDGQTRTSLDVNANEIQLLGSRGEAMGEGEFGGRGEAGDFGSQRGGYQRGGQRQPEGDEFGGGDIDEVPF